MGDTEKSFINRSVVGLWKTASDLINNRSLVMK